MDPSITSSSLAPPIEITPISQGVIFRRKLLAELAAIRAEIANWNTRDILTTLIESWEKKFSKALRSSVPEQTICETYIALLQNLLRDPITQAPLDAHSVLGNDGYTYGQMSLAVYQFTISAEYKDNSPLDPNIFPFRTTPHTVVRHLIQWLEKHDALLYSAELERAYLNLLPPQPAPQLPPISKETQRLEKIKQIIARQKEKEAREEEIKKEQILQFEKNVLSKLDQWGEEVKQLVKPLSQSPLSIKFEETLANCSAQTQAVEDKLARLKNRQVKNSLAIEHQLEKAEKRSAEILGLPSSINFEGASEDQASFDRLKQQIEERIGLHFQPLQNQLNELTQTTDEKLSGLSQKFYEEKQALETHIQSQRKDIEKLEKELQQLNNSQQYLSKEITQLAKDQIALKQDMQELEIAIEKEKEKSSKAFLKTVGVVGLCIVGTWAVQCLISSTSLQFSFLPTTEGWHVTSTISF